jgi:hypothetical protein
MKTQSQHIDSFCELMNRKGYTGNFDSPFECSKKLQVHLEEYLVLPQEMRRLNNPFAVDTFSKGIYKKGPFVRCGFDISYTEADGFRIQKLNIQYGNEYGVIREKELPLNGNESIPDSKKAERMVEHKNGMKI